MMQRGKDGWSWRGWIGAVLAGCVVWGAAICRAQAAPAASAPTGATTQPAGERPSVSQVFRPAPKGLSVVEASTLTDEEKSLVNLATDGDDQWMSTGLYVLLRRAEMLPDSKAAYDAATQIDTMSFWSTPAVLRGKLVRFDALYAGRGERAGVIKAGPNDWWGGKQFYTIFVKAKADQDAIVVAVTEPPPADLRLLTKLSFAGFFYKTFQWTVSADSGNPMEKRVYPMLVAKKAYRFTGEVSSPLGGSTGVLVAIAGGLVVFAMVRAYIRARQRQAQEAKELAKVAVEAPEVDFDIDPELGRQVEQFQAERSEGGHGRDKKNPAP
jgi:hypothetical protein